MQNSRHFSNLIKIHNKIIICHESTNNDTIIYSAISCASYETFIKVSRPAEIKLFSVNKAILR